MQPPVVNMVCIPGAGWTWCVTSKGGVCGFAAVLMFLFGVIVVTAAVNVPLNDELAVVQPGSGHGAEVWARYLSRWTAWNAVRAASATVATAVLAWSARR